MEVDGCSGWMGWPNAGQHQQMRRVDRSAAQDHLPPRAHAHARGGPHDPPLKPPLLHSRTGAIHALVVPLLVRIKRRQAQLDAEGRRAHLTPRARCQVHGSRAASTKRGRGVRAPSHRVL